MKKILETLIFALLLVGCDQINAQYSESALMSVEEYQKKLAKFESEGGVLFCESKEGGKREKFDSCKHFTVLQDQGCYGLSTPEIGFELWYASNCEEIEAIKQARNVNTNYFELNHPNWWRSLPAEIIPMPGGIYSEESWSLEKSELNRLVSGKLLGELKFKSQVVKNGEVELVLSSTKEDCGEIRDVLVFSPVLLADFDNDGVAELLIKGHRNNESESCLLGTGNSLGAGFAALLKKANSVEKPVIMPYPGK